MLVMKANTESPTVVTAWTDTVQLQTPSTNFKVSFAPVQIQTASEIRASQRCTQEKLQFLRDRRYHIIEMWECD